jgi:hypothetical protein
MSPNHLTNRAEPLLLARPLAILFGVAMVAAAGVRWGAQGSMAAALGAVVSIANVYLMARLGQRAQREATEADPGRAAARLNAALGAKTIALLVVVAFIAQLGPVRTHFLTPFTLGLLVTVFALIAAGLIGRPA